MGRLQFAILLLLALALSIFVSCKKDEYDDQEDYRMKWIGTYKCQKESDYGGDSTKNVFLNVTLIDGDSLLNIKEEIDSVPLGQEWKYMNVKVKADSYGDMWYCSGINMLSYNFRASFYGDSIYVRYYLLSGHNCSPRFIYKGQKQ